MIIRGQRIQYWLAFGWLTGPIFGKELRVSSRRRRYYVLRTVYLLLLLIFIAVVWLNLDVPVASASVMATQMSMAGAQVVALIVVFQFVALQLLAVSMLSTAVSDEISHRTLGVLMTTPINSFQIVMGKLLSRVVQLLLMTGITVPLLAMMRVFGGVPWDFILASISVTVTTILFAGALSLLLSVRGRQAHGVILRTLMVLVLFFGILPTLPGLLLQLYSPNAVSVTSVQTIMMHVTSVVTLVSPWAQMSYQTARVLEPSLVAVPLASYWGFHCLIILALTLGLLTLAVRRVRRAGLSQAVGQLSPDQRGRRRTDRPSGDDVIRRVCGACVIWKELRRPLIQGGKKKAWIGFVAAVAVQVGLYGYYGRNNLLQEDFTHIWCVGIFLSIGLIGSIFLSATTITSEKETQSWPILLSTPLDDRHILWGKALGALRRCLPAWLFLVGHLVVFVGLGYIHMAAVPVMAMIVFWVIVFVSGTGLYFGIQCRKTGSAVIANLAVVVLLWLVLPTVFLVLSLFSHNRSLLNTVSFANPLIQSMVAMDGLAGSDHAGEAWGQLRFRMLSRTLGQSGSAFLGTLSVYASIYFGAGVGLMALAKYRLRKRIF